MIHFKYMCYCLLVLLFFSCKEPGADTTSDKTQTLSTPTADSKAAIVFTTDGKTRSIGTEERVGDPVNFEEPTVRYLFRKKTKKNEKPQFEVNFAFSDKESLSDLPKTYNLTEDPALQSVVSLNFFDFEREVKSSTGKKLIFDKGKITIHELDENKIHFDFEGEAHEMTKKDRRSKVSGKVQVQY